MRNNADVMPSLISGCWITSRFPVQRMVLDYVWMFIACLFNIVAYVPLYFVLRGTLVLALTLATGPGALKWQYQILKDCIKSMQDARYNLSLAWERRLTKVPNQLVGARCC